MHQQALGGSQMQPIGATTSELFPSVGFKLTATRRPLSVQWTDAAGAHSASLDGRALIGSSERSAIVVADRAVSRLHAEIEVLDDGAWLRDLRSRNGTWIDDVLIDRARVPPHGRFRIGTTQFVLRSALEPTRVP